MGGGTWTEAEFTSYSYAKGRSVTTDGVSSVLNLSAQSAFVNRTLDPDLDPNGAKRECRDTEEHPETLPVILALDVTGSMGGTAVEVAGKLNVIMKNIYKATKDVEFLIMAIGDLAFDYAPIQASQFESDIRIADQLDKIFFEGGGGWNEYESYTASWFFGLHQTDCDCWSRGKKGVIITLGDEELNPTLPLATLKRVTGMDQMDSNSVETKQLYKDVSQKYSIYHINITHRTRQPSLDLFDEVLGKDHVYSVGIDGIEQIIPMIVATEANQSTDSFVSETSDNRISADHEIEW